MKPKAIIVDIDGTLANIDHRRHFVDPRYNSEYVFIEDFPPYYEKLNSNKIFKPDWDAFNAAMSEDAPNEWCVQLLEKMCFSCCSREYEVLFITGRMEKYREITEKQIDGWVDLYPFDDDQSINLFMRPDDDFRPDVEIKREIYEKRIRDNYDVLFCLDDNAEIVGLWRSFGLVCLDCAGYRR